MTIDTEDLLNSIMASLDRIEYVKPEDIPNIDLYMDQVTTFMDRKLRSTARYPGEDKILTKTMINNYAKNDLLPPPVKKKYSREHVLLLILIYYYKSILSINDIQTLLRPITEQFFQSEQAYSLEKLYEEILGMDKGLVDRLKEDIKQEYKESVGMFSDAPEESREFLRKFGFICRLSFDVYLKKLMIEKMVDELAAEQTDEEEKSDKKNVKEGKQEK